MIDALLLEVARQLWGLMILLIAAVDGAVSTIADQAGEIGSVDGVGSDALFTYLTNVFSYACCRR